MLLAGLVVRGGSAGFLVGGGVSLGVGVLGAAVLGLSSRYVMADSNPSLLTEGIPGTARVLAIARTGWSERKSGYDIGIAFNLLVQLPEREPFEVLHHRQMVPDIHIPAIQPGLTINVLVDPERNQELIINFGPTGASPGQTASRSRTMPTTKKKELYIPIGVKLIAIVSLILVGSLGGIMFLATGNFGRTMERTLKDDTMSRAELLSQKIESRSAVVHRHGASAGGRSRDRGAGLGHGDRRRAPPPWPKCPTSSRLSS